MSNLERKQVNNKILIIGVDGMDPRATEHYLAEGKMPNVQKLLEQGAANEHLEMIGGHPTGTPPMWTTLATGCYANVHGITDFTLQSDKGPEYTCYGFDSRRCRAEQLWNVFAEEGMKTLVFHWPGSSWPPTSDSPNLHVIDGTEPIGVGFGTSMVGHEFFAVADKNIADLTFKRPGEAQGVAPCAISDVDLGENDAKEAMGGQDAKHIILENREGTEGYIQYTNIPNSLSPLKEAANWVNAPEGALEFTILMSGGLLRRPALLLKNENGVYDRVAVYTSKKAEEPIVILPRGEMVGNIMDIDYRGSEKIEVVKSMRVVEIAEDGSRVRMYISDSYDIYDDSIFHPKSLHDDIVKNVGYPQNISMMVPEDGRGQDLFDCMLPLWDRYCAWMADTLHYLIEKEKYDVIFSHNHNVDAQMHTIARNMKHRNFSQYSAEEAQQYMEEIYKQTDRYVGRFLHYIDEGWTVFLVSDHALVCPEYERPQICEGSGVHAGGIMRDLGFTVMIKDENGNDTHEIDWSKTKAINSRNNNIYLNLKAKYDHGIISPEEQYEVEEEIMTALYSVKHPISGKRVIGLALRNKDAIILGYGGDQCGDIIIWTAEGYNDDHFDAITTTYGLNYTSLMPILIAAGKGINPGLTKRVIRQVDFAPTVAVIGGVRMPRECEGAPIYQILEKNY